MKAQALSSLLLITTAFTLSGCVGGSVAGSSAPTVYLECDYCTNIADGTTSQIRSFPTDGTAGSTITSPLPGFRALRADAHGNLYTTTFSTTTNTYAVAVFAHGASGAAAPIRTFTSPLMTQLNAFTVAPDGTVYFADHANGLLRFDPTASGTATPTQFPGLYLVGMVTDASGNLYATVSAGGVFVGGGFTFAPTNIVVYNAGFTNTTPSRVIVPSPAAAFNHLAVDASGTIYASGSTPSNFLLPILTPEIAVFAPNTGAIGTPTRTITSSALAGGDNLALDHDGNLYVRTAGTSLTPFTLSPPRPINILKFGPTANGNAAPDATIVTGMDSLQSYGIAVY